MRRVSMMLLSAIIAAMPLLASADGETVIKNRKTVLLRDGEFLSFEGDPMDFELLAGTYLGVGTLALTEELRAHFGAPNDAGVLVSRVEKGSPADRAGFAVGDVITKIDGERVTSVWNLRRAIRDKKEGDRVEVDILRNRAALQLSATVDKRRPLLHEDVRTLIGKPAREAVDAVSDFFRSPEWKGRMAKLGDCARTQTRLRELENRLKELEKKLEK